MTRSLHPPSTARFATETNKRLTDLERKLDKYGEAMGPEPEPEPAAGCDCVAVDTTMGEFVGGGFQVSLSGATFATRQLTFHALSGAHTNKGFTLDGNLLRARPGTYVIGGFLTCYHISGSDPVQIVIRGTSAHYTAVGETFAPSGFPRPGAHIPFGGVHVDLTENDFQFSLDVELWAPSSSTRTIEVAGDNRVRIVRLCGCEPT
jgi:hypothetical protein